MKAKKIQPPSQEAIEKSQQCHRHFVEVHYVCGGCGMQHYCGVLQHNAKVMDRFFGESIRLGNIQSVEISPIGAKKQ